MRNNPTPAEKRLWHFIRSKRLGVKFGRQRLVLGYIADFYCASHSIVVEIDGSVHASQSAYDGIRDKAMERIGMTVLRFSNQQVFKDIVSVVRSIRDAVNK